MRVIRSLVENPQFCEAKDCLGGGWDSTLGTEDAHARKPVHARDMCMSLGLGDVWSWSSDAHLRDGWPHRRIGTKWSS